MNILTGLLIAVELVVSLLLILIILVQPSKSGGLGGAAFGGGGMGEQLFGARAGNVLTKGTVLFAVIFMVNTLALAFLYARGSDDRALSLPAVERGVPEGMSGVPAEDQLAVEPTDVIPVEAADGDIGVDGDAPMSDTTDTVDDLQVDPSAEPSTDAEVPPFAGDEAVEEDL